MLAAYYCYFTLRATRQIFGCIHIFAGVIIKVNVCLAYPPGYVKNQTSLPPKERKSRKIEFCHNACEKGSNQKNN